MKKSFGKATLGGGNKMSVYLHGYGRSTHNLNKVVRTPMNVGTLIPLYTNIGLNGDTWNIDLNALIKTKPAIAPLFGTYKYQVDVFTADMRLYISALHNNPLNVGLNVEKIKIPTMKTPNVENSRLDNGMMFNQSSLNAYLGLRGIAKNDNKEFNAIPMLAYYDIYKNYYANKQEGTGVVISGATTINTPQEFWIEGLSGSNQFISQNITKENTTVGLIPSKGINVYYDSLIYDAGFRLSLPNSQLQIAAATTGTVVSGGISFTWIRQENITKPEKGKKQIIITATGGTGYNEQLLFKTNIQSTPQVISTNAIPFQLSNIDDMRESILATPFYQKYEVNSSSQFPYGINAATVVQNNKAYYASEFSQNGIAIKTFQSDIFQNWLNVEWVDGVNGISEVTKVDTSEGLNLDALNLAQKVYNMLNRIAVSGGSWEDWQEAVYGNNAIRRAESPVYHGGMSCRIGFEEVTSNASANDAEGDNQPLGTLAGKGQQFGKKGGRVTIHVKEPCVIMVIASITPYIDYSQGTKWYMRELKTINDLHKPALDGIGFQNIQQNQLVATANLNKAFGKSPAWIHYMTDVNECYGEFAVGGKERYMVLQKEFEINSDNDVSNTTTYIDPTQFNYTFADKSLSAQNFWVQQAFDIKCRRIMSAKVIPNL